VSIVKKKNFNVEYKRVPPQVHRGIARLNWYTITQVREARSAVLGSYS